MDEPIPELRLVAVDKDWSLHTDSSVNLQPGKWYLYRVDGTWFVGYAYIHTIHKGFRLSGWHGGSIPLGSVKTAYQLPDPPADEKRQYVISSETVEDYS